MKYLALLLGATLLAGCGPESIRDHGASALTPSHVAPVAPKPLSPTEIKIKEIIGLYQEGKLNESKSKCEELLKAEPKNAAVHYERGNIWQYENNNDMALTEFKTSLELDPSFYYAQRDIWYLELEKTADDKAKAELKTRIKEKAGSIISADKPSDKLYSFGFYAYNLAGVPEKAEEMKTALVTGYPLSEELNGVGNEVFENMLMATQGANRPKRALMSESYVKDFPNHSRTDYAYRFLLGFYWKDQPNADKIRKYAAMWVAAKPEYPLALATSARVCAEMSIELDKAVKWAADAIKCMPNTFPTLAEWSQRSDKKPFWFYEWQFTDDAKPFDILDTVAWVYYKKGDFAKAESYMNQAMQYENFHSRLWYHLGKIYEAQGKTDAAIDALTHSLISRSDVAETPPAIKKLLKKKYDKTEAEINQFYQRLPQDMAVKEGLPFFTDVTTGTGLAAVASGRKAAWGDYDNDGWQDILLNGSILWRNKGDGTFEDVTKQSQIIGLDKNGKCIYVGGVWADYDNNGWLDFFSAGTSDALWHNNGDGTFTNVTDKVNPKMSDSYPSEGAGWGDYDRDGFVDLYVANYEQGQRGTGMPDFLYKNEKGQTFKDVTKDAGITPKLNLCGYGINWGDYNNDGWLDIFVSNYRLNPDFLWRNNGNGTFTNAAKEVGVEGTPVQGAYGHTIGSEWADYDNDSNLDLFQCNLAHPRYITFSNMSYLLRNNGAPDYCFTERRIQSGIRYEETHSEPAWGDYDNDGLLDLYITSVYVNMPSFLYRQSPKGQFTDVTWMAGVRITDGWGCAWADFDNDGDIDLLVCDNTNKVHLFRNEAVSKTSANVNNWLEIKLVGSDCNTATIGARLILSTGQDQYTRQVEGGKGSTNQNSLVQHFGLGRYSGLLELSVHWPCGKLTKHQVEINKIITIKEP
ncbi:MAG: FG-GAP-like repeat-containing protein [Planctomycetota bacterium]